MNLIAALVLAVATAAPAPTLPATPAGTALNAWLQAFNSGDKTAVRDFMQRWEPARLKYIDGVLQFRAMSGGFDLRAIESSTPTKLVAVLEDRNGEQYARATMTLTDSAPYTIASFPIDAIHTPDQFAPPHLSQAQLVTATQTKLDQVAAAGKFSGAVMIAYDGKPVLSQAFGLADRAKNIPNTVDTRFNIGSMNKMFTAVATLQLVQQGKVRLDAPVGTYLPDYPNKDVASQVTIAQLLTHTGGTGDFFGPEFEKHAAELRTLADYEHLFGTRAPKFPPGSKFDYSNYGYIILGLVIEKVSGENYYDYVQKHVYEPAGMTSSGSEPYANPAAGTSVAYTQDESGTLVPSTGMLGYRGVPAGGGYSTVGDLVRFADALLANKLLDAHYTELLTTGKVDTDNGGRYAYGFGDDRWNGVRCFGHNGGGPGINGELEICPQSGYVVASLANMDPPAASKIEDFITNRLPLP